MMILPMFGVFGTTPKRLNIADSSINVHPTGQCTSCTIPYPVTPHTLIHTFMNRHLFMLYAKQAQKGELVISTSSSVGASIATRSI